MPGDVAAIGGSSLEVAAAVCAGGYGGSGMSIVTPGGKRLGCSMPS